MVSSPNFLVEQSAPGAATSDLQPLQVRDGDLHLRFLLSSKIELALPAIGVREILSPSPDRITPIPNISPLMLGVMNLRGQVIWVADLGQFLGDPVPLNIERNEIPVIAIEGEDIILGLAVEQVLGTDWLANDQLRVPMDIPDAMAPFVQGEWPANAERQYSSKLLDTFALLRSARWGL
jgi:purine-binding chemotaxis protein CheW